LPIKNFRDPTTENFFKTGKSKGGWQQAAAVALRKLDMLNAAGELKDLRSPPGNRLEALSGNRQGQWSIRINDQWRICFVWTDAGPAEVEIVDYH
jgi:proteic killer suppression protein